MDELLRLLTEYGADETVIDLATRWAAATIAEDGTITWPDGATPLTDEEIDTLSGALIALADDDEASTAILNAAVDVVSALGSESTRREAASVEEEQANADARAALRGDAPEASDTDPAAPEAPADPEADPADPPADPDADPEDPPADPDDPAADPADADLVPVTASSTPAAARRRPRAPRGHEPQAAVEAGAAQIRMLDTVAGVATIGTDVTLDQVDRALADRAESFRGGGGSGQEWLRIARISMDYPEDRRLQEDSVANGRIVTRALSPLMSRGVEPRALTAAGICAPPTPIYTQITYGDARRPIRDALAGFQATRGGAVSVTPPLLPDLTGAVALWTHENDALPPEDRDPEVKPCLEIDCGSPVTTQIDAVTLCLTFGNFGSRTFGEVDNAYSSLGMVAHARFAEQNLISEMRALLQPVNLVHTAIAGTIDLLEALARAAARMRAVHRMPDNYPFRVVLPTVVRDMIVEDTARRMPGGASNTENLAVAEATILSWFARRNLNVTFSPDIDVMGAQANNAALVAWPTAIDVMLYPEGTFLFLDGGVLDLGVVRDSTLNAANKFQTFMETFEAVHRIGPDGVKFQVNFCLSGAVMGTRDPEDFCAGLS